MKLVFLKMKNSERADHTRAYNATEWLTRLGLDPNSDYIAAGESTYKEIIKDATEKTNEFIETVRADKRNSRFEKLKEFFTGVFEGDGSFQLYLKEKTDAQGNPKEPFVVMEPKAALYNRDERDDFPQEGYYKLVNTWFGTNGTTRRPSPAVEARELDWKSCRDVLKLNSRLNAFHINRLEYRKALAVLAAENIQSRTLYSNPTLMKEIVDLRHSKNFSNRKNRENLIARNLQRFFP